MADDVTVEQRLERVEVQLGKLQGKVGLSLVARIHELEKLAGIERPVPETEVLPKQEADDAIDVPQSFRDRLNMCGPSRERADLMAYNLLREIAEDASVESGDERLGYETAQLPPGTIDKVREFVDWLDK